MRDRTERFEIEGTPVLQLRIGSGSVRLTEGEAGAVTVRLSGSQSALDRYRIEQAGDVVEIGPEPGARTGLAAVKVIVESGAPAEVRARLGSCDFTAVAPLAALQVDAGSGDIRVDRVDGEVTVRSASGDLRIGSADGIIKVTSASGDLHVGAAKGGADLKTASGDMRFKIADGGIKVKSASGDVVVENLREGDLDAKMLSGDVTVGVPTGRTLEVKLDAVSGKVVTQFPVTDGAEDDGDGVERISRITVKTVSGDILLRPAT
ncbi:MAG: DUF4097 domain-containing protein [Actinobacteria bacterium]|nr:DUF4097 domain-containing protein [Actinomycetota bacterium]